MPEQATIEQYLNKHSNQRLTRPFEQRLIKPSEQRCRSKIVLPLSSGKPLVMRRSGPPAVCASMAVSNVIPSLQGNFFQGDSISFLLVWRAMGYT